MKFLVDACVPRLLASTLIERGYEVLEVRAAGNDPGDVAILQRAVAEDRVLVTMHRDYGMLALGHSLPHRGIIELPHGRFTDIRDLLLKILDGHHDAVIRSSVITARPRRIRVLRTVPRGR